MRVSKKQKALNHILSFLPSLKAAVAEAGKRSDGPVRLEYSEALDLHQSMSFFFAKQIASLSEANKLKRKKLLAEEEVDLGDWDS